MLTIAAAKAAEPRTRAYKMADAHGLYLFVAPTGLKSWRMKYRFGGKEKLLTFGRFPEMSLGAARARREAAKAQLRDGIDPKAGAGADDFRSVALAWHALQRTRWSATHAGDVLSSLERDVFPAIGARPIGEIRATELLNVIRSVEQRSKVATARRLRQRLSAIFRYAISQELAEADPAAQLDQAMQVAPLSRPMPAITDIDGVRALIVGCEAVDGMRAALLAHHFLALTAARLSPVRFARWEQFEGLETAEPTWRIPARRMKLSQAKKAEERFDHLVPLSAPAVAVLREAADLFPYLAGGLCFPSSGPVFPGRGAAGVIGEGAIGELIRRAGFAGRHVPHGWRSSFSTILNEDFSARFGGEEWRSTIDRALAHAPKDKVEAAYNRSEQLDRRRAVFDRWGELLAI